MILKVCVLLACVASGAEARTQYACVYKQSNKAPSGSANLIIVVDEKTGEVGTWDSFSNGDHNKAYVAGQPQVELTRRSDGSQVFLWESPDVRLNSYSSDIDFRAVIDASGGLDLTASLVSYPPAVHITGTCEITKGNYQMPKDWKD